MENTISDRLRSFIEYLGLNGSQFAERCGIPKPSLSQVLTGRNKKVSNQLIATLHTVFPDLNVMWLLFGEGPMVKSSASPESGPGFFDEVRNDPEVYYGSRCNIGNANFPGNPSSGFENSNVEALTGGNFVDKSTDAQLFEYENKIRGLQVQIENLQRQVDVSAKNPRKVSQITVYYDDSTFETFQPVS